ncbi:PilZ domain-containing protein [Sphingomonas koreensis]|nr:PilZ domain-containing protein [Sphingomonas koreensis]
MHIGKRHETVNPAGDRAKDRRSSPRLQTVLRVARVMTGTDQGFARVQNISDVGIGLQLHLPVLLGDALAVELADGVVINGRVVWTSGADCGLQLDQPIDSAALLVELAAQAKAGASRPLRLPVATPALTRSANGTRVVEVADVSQRGMKLRHDGSISDGLHVKITLPSGLKRSGVVRWSQDRIAGVLLLDPFSPEELGSVRNL